MKIVFLPEVLDYFNELSTVLYENDYFGFEADAMNYVDELLKDIQTNLSTSVQKPAPTHFDKYGARMSYATFRRSKSTQWYVFFTKYKKDKNITYLIRHISNNHVIAQFL